MVAVAQGGVEAVQKDIELPPSWVDHLVITKKGTIACSSASTSLFLVEFQERYPHCRKTYFYKKTRVEKYAPYHMKDGIVLKISEFADYDCKFGSNLARRIACNAMI